MKLQWKEIEPTVMTWWQAYTLQINGWRLPTLKELEDADNNKIEGFLSTFFWTNNEPEHTIDFAWYYVFGTAEKGTMNKEMSFYIRLCKEIK